MPFMSWQPLPEAQPALEGRKIKISHGLERTVEEIKAPPEDERAEFKESFQQLYRDAPPYSSLTREAGCSPRRD